MQLIRPIKTRFRYGYTCRLHNYYCLTLLYRITRRLILQKARGQAIRLAAHSPPTPCKHTVSGSISLPSRGSFRLSLTVLVHYRSLMSL